MFNFDQLSFKEKTKKQDVALDSKRGINILISLKNKPKMYILPN